MSKSELQKYKYYAFISYSRKDSRQAKWLQRRLEWFRIPTKIVLAEDYPHESRYIRPVYRDKTNLEVDNAHYWNNIKGAIQDSRYFIVLSSPASAASLAVDAEVRWFLETHDSAHELLIPIVLSGRVADGGVEECLCPALLELGEVITSRNLPSMVPDSDDHEKDAWENGFIGAVSYMLQIHRSFLTDHLRREEKKKAFVTRIIAVTMGLLAISAVSLSVYAQAQTKAAIAAKLESQAKLERSWFEEGLRWWESARGELAVGNASVASLWAARSVGFDNFGREKLSSSKTEWDKTYPPLLKSEIASDPMLNERRLKTLQQVDDWIVNAPNFLPIWASPEIRHTHNFINKTAFSWDGSRLATTSRAESGSELQIWNMDTGEQVTKFLTDGLFVSDLAINQEGNVLATSEEGNDVLVWHYLKSSAPLRLQGHTGPVTALAFSEDGRRISSVAAVKSSQLELKIWNAESGDQLASALIPTASTEIFRLSRDGSLLGVISEAAEQSITLWETLPVKRGLSVEASDDDLDFALGTIGSHITILSKTGDVRQYETRTGKGVMRMHMSLETEDARLLSTACTDKEVTVIDGKKLRSWSQKLQKEGDPISMTSINSGNLDKSPDGRFISGSNQFKDGTISVWNAGDGSPVFGEPPQTAIVNEACFNRDGTIIVTIQSYGKEVCIWNALTGSLERRFSLPYPGSVRQISINLVSDQTAVALVNDDATSDIIMLDNLTGKTAKFMDKIPGEIQDIQYSPDASLMAVSINHQDTPAVVQVWDVATQKVTLTSEFEHGFRKVVFNEDGSMLASSGPGGIKAWDLRSGKEFPCANEPGVVVAFQKGQNRLLAGVHAKLDFHDLATGKKTGSIPSHDEAVTAVTSNLAGIWATGSQDQSVRIWGSRIGHWSTPPLGGKVEQVTFSPDGNRLLTVASGRMILWNAALGRQRNAFSAHDVNGMNCAYSSDGSLLATSSWDGVVKIWSTDFKDRQYPAQTGQPMTVLYQSNQVKGIGLSRDGRVVVTSVGDSVKLRDTVTGSVLRSLDGGHYSGIEDLKVNADLSIVVSSDGGGHVRIWNLEEKTGFMAEFRHSADSVYLSLSKDGNILASGSYDGDIKIWSIKDRRELASFAVGHKLNSLNLSPDATQLACGFSNGEIRTVSSMTGEKSHRLAGHHKHVSSMGFSPDGRLLLSGSANNELILWDAIRGTLVSRWVSIDGGSKNMPVHSISFSPDGSSAVTCSEGAVRYWDTAFHRTDLASFLDRRLFENHQNRLSVSVLGNHLKLTGSQFFGPHRSDAMSDLSATHPGSGRYNEALMRAKLQTRDIQGAIQFWKKLGEEKKQSQPVQHVFLMLLLDYLAHEPDVLSALYGKALENFMLAWTDDDYQQVETTLLLVKVSDRNLTNEQIPSNLREALKRLLLKAPLPTVTAVSQRLGQQWLKTETEVGKARITDFVASALNIHQDSPEILWVNMNVHEKGSETWQQLAKRLRSSPSIRSDDYLDLATLFPDEAENLFAECSRKWPHDQTLQRNIAWRYLEKNKPSQALSAFRKSLLLRHPQDEPKPFILVGFCATLWSLGEKEEAKANYFKLLKSPLWADVNWLGKLKASEWLKKNLIELNAYCELTEPGKINELKDAESRW